MLFALCFFHALALGRRKFGFQGFSRQYPFNNGDISVCAKVMHNYLEANDDVPWDDLQYNFGEIMYGGHITDYWDRRITNTYLKVLLSPALLDEKSGLQLAPGYPPCLEGDAATYAGYIEENLPAESPVLFGLHPNSQISLLQQQASTLFSSVLVLSGSGGGGGGGGKETRAADTLADLKNRLPAEFKMIEIRGALKEAPTPYVVCALQELERANAVLAEMGRALTELELGLQGALNISDLMEALIANLTANEVPPLCLKILPLATCHSLLTTHYVPTRCRRSGSRSAARSVPRARITASRSPLGSPTFCFARSSSRRGSTSRANSTRCRPPCGSPGCGTRWATSPRACR